MELGARPDPAYLATLDRPSLIRLAEILGLRLSKGKSQAQLIRSLLATPTPTPPVVATPAQRSLAVASPAFAAAWHPTKNGDLTPTDVSARSEQRVW